MMHRAKRVRRILALILVLAAALPAAPALAESYKAVVTRDSLAVYAKPTLQGKSVALDAYTIVTVSATSGNVAQLKSGKYTGYASVSGLTALNETAVDGVTNRATRVFAKPALDSASVAVPKGFRLKVLYANDTYAIVENDQGAVGYAVASHLNIDSAPAEEGGVVVETYDATVIANTLPVYKSASSSSKLLGTLAAGAGVTVYARNADWAYIGRNGKFGFCVLAGLERGKGQGSDDGLENAVKVTVTANTMKVYKSASTSSKLLGTLRKGTQVNLVKIVSGSAWAYIELNGQYGYCSVSAITSQSDGGANQGETIDGREPLGTATVVQTSAPVYASMNASSPATSLRMGETVSYYGYDTTWVLVGRDGSFGFMKRNALSAISYTELKLEDSGAGVVQLETALLSLGYLDSVPGSNYTAITSAAVQRLQAAVGMTQSGTADVATLRVLFSGNAPASPLLSLSLSKGNENENVRRLQSRLLALGYLSRESSVDGEYGNNTAGAVRLFQTAAGISATGTADSKTIRALYSASAPSLGSGKTPADQSTDNGSGGGSSGNTTSIPAGLASTTSTYSPSMSNAQKLEYVIYVAQQQLGKRYVFGSAGPSTFDCSGLMMYCFDKIGISLQHSAQGEGYNDAHQKISSKASLIRGDMVFFNTVSDGDMCDHVGIYLGKNYCLHAGSGAGKVIISTIASGYYSRVFSWGRRILNT